MLKKSLAKLFLFLLVFNLIPLNNIGTTYAVDIDGTANLNLTVTPSVSSGAIIWSNFNYNFTLTNNNSSEWDAFKNWFILNVPTWITFISWNGGLWTPVRNVSYTGWILYFFQTQDFLTKWSSKSYSVTLKSANSASLFTNYNIKVLWYANDNIYGRWAVPIWAPGWTLPGWVDVSNSVTDPSDLTFPNNITAANYSTLTYANAVTSFIPYDISKSWAWLWLIGNEYSNTITVHGNSLWQLNNIHVVDVIPNNRKFVWFTATGWVGSISVSYDTPNPWEVTLDLSGITVPMNSNVNISYKTLALAFPINAYTGWTILLDTGSVILDRTSSVNRVNQQIDWTWNDGTTNIAINTWTVVWEKTHDQKLWYAELSKSVNKSSPVIWESVRYTIWLDVAKNVAFSTSASGTYISDKLPDWLTFSGTVSSLNTGIWSPLTYISNSVDANGDTTILWRLNSWEVKSDDHLTITYDATVDGVFEWPGEQNYENTETLTNTATFFWTISDSTNNAEWWYTDNSIIDSSVTYTASSSIKAPSPTNEKRLISIELPDTTIYNHANPLPANTKLPVGSKLTFWLVMDFPNVLSTWAFVRDALPLLTWPNNSVYDIAFQTNPTLRDINNNLVPINDNNDDWNADTNFNWLTLSWTTMPNSSWISTSPANNIDFDLWEWNTAKTFSVIFSVDILPAKPSGYNNEWFLPEKNVSIAHFKNDVWSISNLDIFEVPFDIALPAVTLTKTMSGTNIEAGSNVDYKIVLNNTWEAAAYVDDIIDTLPSDLTLQSFSMAGSWFSLANQAVTQSGNILNIEFNTWATLGRSILPKHTSVTINYSVNVWTGILINSLTKVNTVTLNYYSSKDAPANWVNNFWPLTSSSSFTTKQPTLVRNLLSTTESWSTTTNLEIWEDSVYENIITLPGGRYNNSTFVDTANANLQFLTGTVVWYSGSLSFSTGTTFTWNTVNFWTINNSDTWTGIETIVIYTTYKTKTGATNGSKVTTWTFNYNATNKAATKNVSVTQPNILVNKSVTPTTWDAGDTINYTISLTNNGNANAYDLALTDTLNSHFTFVTGSLVLNWFTWSESDFLSWSGVTLGQLNISGTKSITFQALVNDDITPSLVIPNTANISYSSLDANNSVYEKTYTGSSTVNFTVNNLAITHTLTSTDDSNTWTGKFNLSLYDLHIWEQATYKTTLTIPESTFTWLTIKQSLPAGYKFLSGSIWASVVSHSLSWIVISPDNTITYTLWDISNPWTNGVKTIDVYSELVVIDNVLLTSGQQKWLSTATGTWQTTHSVSTTTNLDIVEPNLTISKTYDINNWDAWDTALTTITITNNWTAPAYDVVWNDYQSSYLTSTWVNYYTSSGTSVLNIWDTITYSYNSILKNTVTAWQIITWTASVDYTSASGSNSYERAYPTVSSTDSLQVIVAWWIAAILNTSDQVKIWDVSSYTIRIPIAEWTTNSLEIQDLLPSWVGVDTGSINITTSTWVVFSGAEQPTFTSTWMLWNLSDLVNSDVDNNVTEYLYIDFDTVVFNTSINNDWVTKIHNVIANYNSSSQKTAQTLPITIKEPSINLDITNVFTHETSQVKYTFSLTNTGTTDWFDLDLATFLPSGVSYTWALNITNTWWAVNLSKTGNTFYVDRLPVNTGNPLTFEIFAKVNGSQNLGDILTLTWDLIYTSQTGTYSQVLVWNTNNTERNGNGWINDYKSIDNTSFTYQDAILDESISVVDDNSGSHLSEEYYTYTVTLTNTWNVALTNIPVTIDIPNYLSGSTFILQTIPGWSSSNYTSTGWTYNNWQLSVTAVNIAIWQSKTIVYKIMTNRLTPGWTNINTIAVVWDTVEWAIWGSPNVSFTVVAPNLSTTSLETDDNGWSLYVNEYITHTSSIKNTGTSTGTNLQVELLYNTWTVTYESGSLDFDTGSLVDTGSIVIDDTIWKITFTIITIWPDVTEHFSFKSKAVWVVWSKVKTTITWTIEEWISSQTVSNELIIVSVPVKWGMWGSSTTVIPKCTPADLICKKNAAGNYIWYRADNVSCEWGDLWKSCDIADNKKIIKETPVKETKEKQNIPEEEKPQNKITNFDKSPVKEFMTQYEEKQKLLNELLKSDDLVGNSLLKALPSVLPKTGTPIASRVTTKSNSKVNTSLPDESSFRLAWSTNTELDYWKQVLIDADKNASKYIVVPSNWLVVPINTVTENSKDFESMINGREINVNNYLKTWVVEYPGTSDKWYGELWNKVVFWHSSYWNDDDGRYKTHFQKIIELDKNEEVWIYEKNSNGEYMRYRYIVTESYNTPNNDTSVLKPWFGKNLTLFTCTPIWGTAGRWIIKAKYIEEMISDLQREVNYTDVSSNYKTMINKVVKRVASIKDPENKSQALYNLYLKNEKIIESHKNNKKITRIFGYLKLWLSKEISKLK